MKILIVLLTLFVVGCMTTSKNINIDCDVAALTACMTAQKKGYQTRVEIQKTPWSNKGIYHSQCQVLINGEWKYVILDKCPEVIVDGHREYQEGVEYWDINKLYKVTTRQ